MNIKNLKIMEGYSEEHKEFVANVYSFLTNQTNTDKIYNIQFSDDVANTLNKINVDYATLCAALIYPFMHVNAVTNEELEKLANPDVLMILNQIKKIESVNMTTREEQAQNVKNLFIALAKDMRVVIALLAIEQQRLNYLQYFSDEKKDAYMHRARDIYAPIAAMLGIGYIKNSFEEAIFKYFKPEEYEELSKELNSKLEERNNQINITIEKLKKELEPLNVNAVIYGRQKQASSIYKKFALKNKTLSTIYDIMAVRVLVDTVEQCYFMLGKIHSFYTPMNNRFKDYIANPKLNGYQSLHTVVIVENGEPLEIQIRTKEMHLYAEYGVAAHWAYKERRKVSESDAKINYIRSVMDLKNKSGDELLDTLKIDVYDGNIFVQTPQGKIIDLPEDSCPIDFAYRIHSNVGNTCVGAKVNGKLVPLYNKLNNGDIVEILTNQNSKGPSRDWLKFVKSSQARAKINAFFKKAMKEENIKKGKSMLELYAKDKNIKLSELMQPQFLQEVYNKYYFTSLEDMYSCIGAATITCTQIINKLISVSGINKIKLKNQENNLKVANVNNKLEVKGFENMLTKVAHCCNPIPGDEIVGYISRGKGLTIHQANCVTLKHCEQERLFNCQWQENIKGNYVSTLSIIAENSNNIISELTKRFSDNKITILSLKVTNQQNGTVIINPTLQVANKIELETVIAKLKGLPNVLNVSRGNLNGN